MRSKVSFSIMILLRFGRGNVYWRTIGSADEAKEFRVDGDVSVREIGLGISVELCSGGHGNNDVTGEKMMGRRKTEEKKKTIV